MTKKEAISIISKCATLYAANLCDQQLAFVYRDALDKRLKESNIKFKDNVAGTTTACLGLALHGNEYIPNTILKEDIRNITPKPPGKIFAIFRKPIRQNIYSELTFQSSSIDITKKCLPLDLLKKVDKSLFIQETPS